MGLGGGATKTVFSTLAVVKQAKSVKINWVLRREGIELYIVFSSFFLSFFEKTVLITI